MGSIRHLIVGTIDALRVELSKLPSGDQAEIDAETYERINEEYLDEFLTEKKREIERESRPTGLHDDSRHRSRDFHKIGVKRRVPYLPWLGL